MDRSIASKIYSKSQEISNTNYLNKSGLYAQLIKMLKVFFLKKRKENES